MNGFAAFDFAAAFGATWLLASYFGWDHTTSMLLVIPMATVAHLATGTYTPLTKIIVSDQLARAAVCAMMFAALGRLKVS